MRARISRFPFGLSHELILEGKASLLNRDINISRHVVNLQQVEKENKNQSKISKRQNKKFYYSNQGEGQQQSGRHGGKWSKKKWNNSGSYCTASAPYPKPSVDRRSQYDRGFRVLKAKSQVSGA